MQSELKPCPFCGGENICPSSFDIQCQECKAMMAGDPDAASARWNRRATLSDQERAVEVKALEWRAEPPYHVARIFGNVYAVEAWDGGVTLSGIGGRRDFKTVSDAKAAAQADYEQRIRSALVDVPVEPVRPVAWLRVWNFQGNHCPDEFTDNEDLAELWRGHPQTNYVIPLYASPPLPHREGEDSAELYRHKKRGSVYTVVARGRLQVDGDLDNEKVVIYRGENGQTWVRPEYEFNDGRFVALAATRSGSATGQTGTDEACPGEHQEVLDAIQSHNSGEEE